MKEKLRGERNYLCSREREIFLLIVLKGLSDKELSTYLGTSTNTIAAQIQSVFRIKEVKSRAELIINFYKPYARAAMRLEKTQRKAELEKELRLLAEEEKIMLSSLRKSTNQ